MLRQLGISTFVLLALAACQQDQTTLKFGPATVFQDRFSDDIFEMSHDDGSDVELRAVRPVGGNSIRGARGLSPVATDQDIFNFGGCGVFGCNANPWSYWAGYSNYTHSWNPYITRNIGIQFRQQQLYTTQAQFAPQGQEGCWNVVLESSHRIRVLRGRSAHNLVQVGVEGNNTTRVQVNVGSHPQFPGTVTIALEESRYDGCQYEQQWQNYGVNQFIWPGCGAQRRQATLRMSGTVSQCGAGGPASIVAAHTIQLNLTPYVNSQLGNYYQMPYFALPASPDQQFFITGRVMDYDQDTHFWGALQPAQ